MLLIGAAHAFVMVLWAYSGVVESVLATNSSDTA